MSFSERFILIGVGGAGGRIANRVAQATGGSLRCVAVDSDFGAVAQLGFCQQIRIGRSRFDGAGSGGSATTARMAAEEEIDTLRKMCTDASMAVVVAGLGGGTGTGMVPTVLSALRDINARTLTIATRPFSFEGDQRGDAAKRVLPLIEEMGDVLAVVENDKLCAGLMDAPQSQTFDASTRRLASGLTLLWRLIGTPGYIALDGATVANILVSGRGRATFGFAEAAGESRLERALHELMEHPGLGLRGKLPSIPAIMLGVVGGNDLRLKEVGDAVERLKNATRGVCDIRVGTVFDPEADGSIGLAAFLFHSWSTPGADEPQETEIADAKGAGAARAAVSPAKQPHATRRRTRGAKAAINADDRFKNLDSTVFEGESLDVPTYLRKGIRIDAN